MAAAENPPADRRARTRAMRRARTQSVIERRIRQAVWWADGREAPRNLFSKRNPVGCGKPRCRLCHGEKLAGEPHPRDVRRAMPDQRADRF